MDGGKWVLLGLVVMTAGCGSSVGTNPQDNGEPQGRATPLPAGIYSGESDCVLIIETEDSGESEPKTSTSALTVQIGPNGIPVEDGAEVQPGDSAMVTESGVTRTLVVVSVTATADGVVVEKTIRMETEDAPELLLEGTAVETYKTTGVGRITYTAEWLLTSGEDPPATRLSTDCEAVLSR